MLCSSAKENRYLCIFVDDFMLFKPCPLPTVTKMLAESVARNFQSLWDYVSDDTRYVS